MIDKENFSIEHINQIKENKRVDVNLLIYMTENSLVKLLQFWLVKLCILLPVFFKLPVTISTTDFVIGEILKPDQLAKIDVFIKSGRI